MCMSERGGAGAVRTKCLKLNVGGAPFGQRARMHGEDSPTHVFTLRGGLHSCKPMQ
jgi:hypothetical protein